MKDFLGKEVNIGDEVVVIGYNRDLHLGNITHVTNKTVQVKSTYFEVKREPQQIFKVEQSTANIKQELIDKTCEWIKEHLYDEEYLIRDNEGTWVDSDMLIDDLKKYMKDSVH